MGHPDFEGFNIASRVTPSLMDAWTGIDIKAGADDMQAVIKRVCVIIQIISRSARLLQAHLFNLMPCARPCHPPRQGAAARLEPHGGACPSSWKSRKNNNAHPLLNMAPSLFAVKLELRERPPEHPAVRRALGSPIAPPADGHVQAPIHDAGHADASA